ncbi:histone H3-like centromeric protein CENH3 isoform X3 [Malania oleifera]|uniref:histone H3-like centromeric protein CENH3 isoform X3 n=1 Tax=Malania oleifera TaxID=397392 RepID=UPI0025AE837F|nr:histone H3-like centromeric protein CENH3 isoform X3 [Malania oleifera]
MARIKHVASRKTSSRRKSAAGVASPSTPGTIFKNHFGENLQRGGRSRMAGDATPSEAGSRNVRRHRRYRPGTVSLQEIRRLQKTWNLLIPAAPFIRTVKEISNFYAPEISRWTAEALTALQENMDCVLIDMVAMI